MANPTTIANLTTSANPAMVTPFPRPDICSDVMTTSLLSCYNSSDDSRPPVTVVIPNEADPRHASCNPPGWNSKLPRWRRYIFSPAVCPSHWTAYEIGKAGRTSTANCCPNGFTLQQTQVTGDELASFESIPGYADNTICEKTQTFLTSVWALATTTSTLSAPLTATPLTLLQPTSPPPPPFSILWRSTKTIYYFHHPYSIQWQASDHLPAPTFSCVNFRDNSGSGYEKPKRPLVEDRYVPMVITFSIVGAIFLAVVVVYVFSSRKKKRLAREQARVE
ncbi:hypothetical protein QBC34DRAFT_472141 [Podospora aff. communis PSN243]|uniref:Uncharacterized protein n=1 Tax=Podospora aff. communis PSN243 TaxID=3040156 RepID=A0AAV9GAZ0_9PEZI|nr:hypothetical protein QBC34DRAFT_472141 [Podospora aff. communis PSN243]